ncbi:hypothetical protein Nmel_018497, partial [Mimus melanotis]
MLKHPSACSACPSSSKCIPALLLQAPVYPSGILAHPRPASSIPVFPSAI